MDSIRFGLNRRSELISDRFSEAFILSSIDLILKNNYFRFNGEIFLQISGTAMGTKMAPTYAILVMGFLEERMYTIVKEVYGNELGDRVANGWLRYIDDCWIIWKESYGDINIFRQILRDLHPSIQFTMDEDRHRLNFLDVCVYKEEDRLETDIYYKPTDSRSYVPFTSAHPKHTSQNIPLTLAKRVNLIVSNPIRKKERLDELKNILLRLKYPEMLINNAFLKANIRNNIDHQGRERKEILPFVSTFNRNNPNIFNDIISPACQSLGLMDSFRNHRFIKAFRQPKSLLRISNKNDKEVFKGITKCNESRCSSCETLVTGVQITLTVDGDQKIFQIKRNMNCLSLNVIYVLICKGCNKFYIGQTGGMFRKRLTLHRQHINNLNYAILGVSRHIANCAKNIKPPFSASPIVQYYRLAPHGTTGSE